MTHSLRYSTKRLSLSTLIKASRYAVMLSALILTSGKLLANNCTNIPDKSPIIKVCKGYEDISFVGQGFTHTHSYGDYKARLTALITSWFERNNIAPGDYCARDTSLIISIPEPNPASYALRVQVELPDSPVLFTVPGNPDLWTEKELQVKVFTDGESYPSSYGYEAGTLMAKVSNSVLEQKDQQAPLDLINNYLKAFGVSAKRVSPSGWAPLLVKPLREQVTLREIHNNKDFERHFRSIDMNTSYEWVSEKGIFDTITLNCNKTKV